MKLLKKLTGKFNIFWMNDSKADCNKFKSEAKRLRKKLERSRLKKIEDQNG